VFILVLTDIYALKKNGLKLAICETKIFTFGPNFSKIHSVVNTHAGRFAEVAAFGDRKVCFWLSVFGTSCCRIEAGRNLIFDVHR
jgi:hypothetical protein